VNARLTHNLVKPNFLASDRNLFKIRQEFMMIARKKDLFDRTTVHNLVKPNFLASDRNLFK
jgi:hypothetical protein